MEEDDDDTLNQASSSSSPAGPSGPSSPNTSTSTSLPMSTISENTSGSLVHGLRLSDIRVHKRNDDFTEEFDDSKTRTPLVPRSSSSSEANRSKWGFMTSDLSNRNAFHGPVARMSSAPLSEDDSVDTFLRTLEFGDSAASEAYDEAGSQNRGNDQLSGKPDFRRGDAAVLEDFCLSTCPSHRSGEDDESGDRETGTRFGIKSDDNRDSLIHFRSEQGHADFSPPVSSSEEFSLLPPAADVSRIHTQERSNSNSASLLDYITASRQHEGKSSKSDSRASGRDAEEHSSFSMEAHEDLSNDGKIPPSRHHHESSQERISLSYTENNGDDAGIPKDGNNASDDEDLEMGLGLFLPSRRKRSRVSRARFVAFLLQYILFLLNFLFWVSSRTQRHVHLSG